MDISHINSKHFTEAVDYAQSIVSGKKIACKENIQAAQRFINDLKREDLDFKQEQFDFVIGLIENTLTHLQGEDLDGLSLRGEPLILQPWQKFFIVNVLGFFIKGTVIRRYNEVLCFLPRKQGKTAFAASLGFALSILERRSGSKLYILANSLKQTMESFSFLTYNIKRYQDKTIRIRDNNQEHSISKEFEDGGSFYIQALASDEERLDSLNSNLLILDEVHTWNSPKRYTLMKNAQKAYRNKLLIAISTAGDKPNGFLANRLEYCKKVLNGTIVDNQYFIFICKADQDEKGNVTNYTDPRILEMASPSLGVTVTMDDLLRDAELAANDPQTRLEFFNKTLNIFTASIKAYFDINEFRASDRNYNWTIDELVKLPIKWYGGCDLSRMGDLTASCLYGRYSYEENGEHKDIDIAITHAFFPLAKAHSKANEDGIPLFGWQDDGVLTMSNTATVHYDDVVKWFIDMRKKGFKIKKVGFDVKFGREFFMKMKQNGFAIESQPQYFHRKSEGFRRIEMKVKNEEFYYLKNPAYEFCTMNLKAIEKTDDMIQYEKIDENKRIDLFDASVFACCQMLEDMALSKQIGNWLNNS